MKSKVINYIKENDMISSGDTIIVGVSGGPDSIALLHLLNSLKEMLEIKLIAAHINHCIRGESADEDEEYVKKVCFNLNIECLVNKVKVEEIAKTEGISTESAGRKVRYSFFYEILNKYKGNKIAVAHNLNDKAETVLMRMMRGSGIEGLVGIKPKRDEIIRPLLAVSRSEIEKYCLENKLYPRIDETNLQTIYARNKVRLEMIPYIEEHFNRDIINTLNRLAEGMSVDSDFLENTAVVNFNEYCSISEGKVIILKEAFLLHEAILTRVIRQAFLNIKGSLENFEKVHIYDVIKLQKSNTGKYINLPENLDAFNNYGNIEIFIRKKEKKTEDLVSREYILKLGENNLQELGINVTIKDVNKAQIKHNNSFTRYFDKDKIKNGIKLRFRRDGDRIVPLGMRGSKKVKDIFIDLKVPKEERGKIPLVCFDEKIGWIVGYKTSDEFKVNKDTKKVLEIKVEREEQ